MTYPVNLATFAYWPTVLGIGGTLAGLIVGFGLNELSTVIRGARENRQMIGKALAELLEVRHHIKTLPLVTESLKANLPGPISAIDELNLRRAIWSLIPNAEGLQTRYEDAVSAVAADFPILSFELRSKDALGPLLGRLRGTLPISAQQAPVWLKMEDDIVRLAIPKLDESILALAKLQKRSTRRDVNAILTKPFDPGPDFTKFIKENIEAALNVAQVNKDAAPVPETPSANSQSTA